LSYDSDANSSLDAIRTFAANEQAVGTYPDYAELYEVYDLVTRLYLYALFNLSEKTTLIGSASYDLVNTMRDLGYAWLMPGDLNQSEHTLNSSLSAGRVNVGIALALPKDTHLRVGGGVEVNAQRRTNNDLDIAGVANYSALNTGQLQEFNSSGVVDNGDIVGLGNSMTSQTTTTLHLQTTCMWYPSPMVSLFGRGEFSLGSTNTIYQAFDTFDDETYTEQQDSGLTNWDATAVFGVAVTPFEQVTIALDTSTSFGGQGSSSGDNLPTGGPNVSASSDLVSSDGWSFNASANVQVRLN
jgi:hypothetical protein